MFGGLWAVARRELVTSSRRRQRYDSRVAVGALVSLAVGLAIYLTFPLGPGGWEVPFGPARLAASRAFAGTVGMLAMAGLGAAGAFGRAVSRERERGTLVKLLTTRLNAFEIVGGKAVAGAVGTAEALAVAAPLVVLLVGFGGGSLAEVALAAAGLASVTAFVGGLALAVSVESRAEKAAIGVAAALTVVWIEGPFLLALFGTRVLPAGVMAWVGPVNLVLMESSPVGLVGHFTGIMPRPSLAGLVVRMIAYQLAGGALLAAWAVVRLRPAARRLGDGPDAAPRRRAVRWVRRRPPCGDDPMDWKERYTSRPGPLGVLASVLGYATTFGVLAFVTVFLARPAWAELREAGYWATSSGDARWTFNERFLRPITGMFAITTMLLVSAQTGEAFDREKSGGSWPVLLASPLTGREILGSKRGAVLRRWWPLTAMVALLWATGLAVGALHPVAAALLAWAWWGLLRFSSALGTYSAMRSASDAGSTGPNLALGVILLSSLAAFLPWSTGGRPGPAVLAATSPPFLVMLAAVSAPEVRALLGRGTPEGVAALGIAPHPAGAAWVAAALAVGMIALGLTTRWLDREVDLRFDAAVGRTDRDGSFTNRGADEEDSPADDADGRG